MQMKISQKDEVKKQKMKDRERDDHEGKTP